MFQTLIVLRMASKNAEMEVSPDWSKNIRDVDSIEFIALSRKEQNRLRLPRKKATGVGKVSKCAVVKYDRREQRVARELERERMVNILMVRTGRSQSDQSGVKLSERLQATEKRKSGSSMRAS